MTDLPPSQSPRILFLFSDTGGGHRSAAEAIIEAIRLEFGDCLQADMVDFFIEYAPLPFNQLPKWYPYMVKAPKMWELGFHLSDNADTVSFINNAAWPYVRRTARNFAKRVQHDLVVSVHPVFNIPLIRAMSRVNPRPFVTVVTDMVSTHASWFSPQADLCMVPTQAAYDRAVKKYAMPKEKLKVVGMPVAERFCGPPANPGPLRERLGWPLDRPVILLMGGGEGMGPIEQNAVALADAGLPAALAVIAGRNQALKEKLEARKWPIPVKIYGFVREMPEFMQAADILVTKAGPGTISEAFNAGLPIILYSRLPGQEDGNVLYTVEEGAGVWAPSPDLVVAAARNWVMHPEHRQVAADACRRIARPQASREIARHLAALAGVVRLDDRADA
jgi:1,2-diacylglycerol 3-beta-galactosyltransferase